MTKINPSDLPGFGTAGGNFVPTENSDVVVPAAVGPDSTIEEIETSDELEKRGPIEPYPTEKHSKAIKPKAVPIGSDEEAFEARGADLVAKHPEYKGTPQFQIKMFHDMIHLATQESRAIETRMGNLQILLDVYPLWANSDDLNELRSLIKRKFEIENETRLYSFEIQQRTNALQQEQQEQQEQPEKKKGLWARIRNK